MPVYTMGIWTAKPGLEHEFVAAWRDFAARTRADFPDETAVLLRDRDKPNTFFSVGPWESLEQIAKWRASETFADGVGNIRRFLDGFEPHTLDPVVTIGD